MKHFIALEKRLPYNTDILLSWFEIHYLHIFILLSCIKIVIVFHNNIFVNVSHNVNLRLIANTTTDLIACVSASERTVLRVNLAVDVLLTCLARQSCWLNMFLITDVTSSSYHCAVGPALPHFTITARTIKSRDLHLPKLRYTVIRVFYTLHHSCTRSLVLPWQVFISGKSR